MSTTVDEMMQQAMAAVRAAPSDASARMRLFRLFLVTGQWERALTQVDTASSLDSSLGLTSMVYKQAIACERFRDEVFAGRKSPVVAGEPAQWLAMMVEALRVQASGGTGAASAAAALRVQALDEAPAVGGRLDGTTFDWIADADSRVGPVCECFIDGKYYWVPFDRINRIELPEPDDVLDMVWASAEVTFTTGGSKHVLMPVRYPGSEKSADDGLRMSRRTEWSGSDDDGWIGLGQRLWTTDASECGMLDVRRLELG